MVNALPLDSVEVLTPCSILINNEDKVTYNFINNEHVLLVYSDDEMLRNEISNSPILSDFIKCFIPKDKVVISNGGIYNG